MITTENKIPKGFFDAYDYWYDGDEEPVMPKSIYDNRKGMKKDLIRNCKNIDSATKKILLTDFEKIDDGDFDDQSI